MGVVAAATIKVPGVGPVKRDWLVYGGGALAVGVGVAYYRRARGAGSEPPVETGQAGGALDDLLGATPYVSGGAPGLFDPDGGSTDGTPPITNNQQWFQAAEDYLAEHTGVERGAAGDALGAFLAHDTVTTTQAGWIRLVLGALGSPPQNGPYEIKVGTTANPSQTATKPSGVRSVPSHNPQRWVIAWNPVPGATGYELQAIVGKSARGLKTFPASTTSYLTQLAPRTGYLAYEVRSVVNGAKSPWARVIIRH